MSQNRRECCQRQIVYEGKTAMIIISDYILEEKDGLTHVRSNETLPCPICQREMRLIGTKRRKVQRSDGAWMTLLIRRFYCYPCKRVHHELPDIIVPYKRHSAKSIEGIINKDEETPVLMEESTINRIQNW